MKQSAGILLYRVLSAAPEVLLVHPGGPYWAGKDDHAWSMPKGEFEPGEDPLAAALREFAEETGVHLTAEPVALGALRTSGKTLRAWAVEGDCDPASLRSNRFRMEWPPRSGRQEEFPEVDRGEWFALDTARRKIHKGQIPLIDALERLLRGKRPP